MSFFIVWLCFAVACAGVASKKGKSVIFWFLLGGLLGPLALIIIFVIKQDRLEAERRSIDQGLEKKCPSCAELVKYEAKKCRFCGNEFDSISYFIETPDAPKTITESMLDVKANDIK